MEDKINRMERRKQKTRELIITTAAQLFQQKSSIEISFENIADRADISRKTLYNHFSSKEDLINEVVSPIFEDGNSFLDTILAKDTIVIADLWNFCLYLWEHYGSRLVLLYNVDFREYSTLLKIHTRFIQKFVETFEKAADLPADLKISCDKLLLIVYKCFVPLLSSICDSNDYKSLFQNAMIGMVKGFTEIKQGGNENEQERK